MKVSIKKISMLVMLGFMLNSTTNCIPKPESKPSSKASAPKLDSKNKASVKKIITSDQVDQINKDLMIITSGANYSDASDAFDNIQSILI